MTDKYKLNQYPATCCICGQEVKKGEGKILPGIAYQDSYGAWTPGKMRVQHIAKCSPVRIRVSFVDGKITGLTLSCDTKAVALLDDGKSVAILPVTEMHSGMMLGFDIALHRLQEDK